MTFGFHFLAYGRHLVIPWCTLNPFCFHYFYWYIFCFAITCEYEKMSFALAAMTYINDLILLYSYNSLHSSPPRHWCNMKSITHVYRYKRMAHTLTQVTDIFIQIDNWTQQPFIHHKLPSTCYKINNSEFICIRTFSLICIEN